MPFKSGIFDILPLLNGILDRDYLKGTKRPTVISDSDNDRHSQKLFTAHRPRFFAVLLIYPLHTRVSSSVAVRRPSLRSRCIHHPSSLTPLQTLVLPTQEKRYTHLYPSYRPPSSALHRIPLILLYLPDNHPRTLRTTLYV
jgi:hypothetical protein